MKIVKIAIAIILVLLILGSFTYNAITALTAYRMSVYNQGVNQAANNILANIFTAIEQKGEVDFPAIGKDGKQSGILTLIKKSDGIEK